MRIQQWLRLARSMGFRYIYFRVDYELKRRSGLLKNAYPTQPSFQSWITLAEWRVAAPAFFFHSRKELQKSEFSTALKAKAKRILDGETQFFQGEWKNMDEHDWLTNPSTGHKYNVDNHWTEIPDFNPTFGDIKYVWERSRFSFLQTILRYDAQSGKNSSEWVFSQIESWIEHNPINQGPNYRCSQETSLRVFNWTLALYFYRYSNSLTEDRFQKILFHIYWQLKHVRSNINFSRIAVRNNHAITETLALYSGGLLFPFFEEAKEWKNSGKIWFEEEIAYQVYEDGTYLQFSFNYHRVVTQLLTWALSLADHHKEKFADVVYQRAYASLNVLLHSQDPISGQLPNYGANDGSLFFQWNDEKFRDYRPSLDTLHYLLTSVTLYDSAFEDRQWFGLRNGMKLFTPITVKEGVFSFPKGGLYGFRNKELLVWINCVNYKDRPSQADALHLDVWYKGRNLLRDGGSYRYNANADIVNYFFGTESHNTVRIDNRDQMEKGPRFIWLDWSEATEGKWETDGDQRIFNGSVKVNHYLGNVVHQRQLKINTSETILQVTDQVTGTDGKVWSQLWHVDPTMKSHVQFYVSGSDFERVESVKYYSTTYGVLEESSQIEFRTHQRSMTTQIKLA